MIVGSRHLVPLHVGKLQFDMRLIESVLMQDGRCQTAKSMTGHSVPIAKAVKRVRERVAFRSSYLQLFPNLKPGCRRTSSDALARSFPVSSVLVCFGCPPGIRTPIGCSRGSCPTIERGGNAGWSARASCASTIISAPGISGQFCARCRAWAAATDVHAEQFGIPKTRGGVGGYSSRSTSSGRWPRMRKLASHPVATASTAVPQAAASAASHCGW
jgi:hypothetical protein